MKSTVRNFASIPAFLFCAWLAFPKTASGAAPLDEPAGPGKQAAPETFGGPMQGAVGSVDRRYDRDMPPSLKPDRKWSAVAWRNERVHGQFVVWTSTGLKNATIEVSGLKSASGAAIPAKALVPHWVRYTMAAKKLCGDILEPARPIDIPPASTRPVWLSVNVPESTPAGLYQGKLTVKSGNRRMDFPLELRVLNLVLPKPSDWAFHLDLWQNPYAVARVHGMKPWSPEHMAKMKEVLTLAANAGQKCLTISILDKPWGGQTHDAFGSMIKTTRKADGTYAHDYSLFDKYVELGRSCGIDKQINCYSMVPWGNRLSCIDAASGQLKSIVAKPGTEAYDAYWSAFLKSFAAHLKQKGWFGVTAIAMDERGLEDMKKMIALLDSVDPEFKIALAANKNLSAIIDRVHDYCFYVKFKPDEKLNDSRAARGRHTTFYVCCGPRKPNTFTFSPPAESAWQGWYAAANRYDGFLRWALCSYTADPFKTTDYPRRKWPSGDCFLIYPGPRSSVRFERLREGIQDFEKVRVLRKMLRNDAKQTAELEAILGNIHRKGDYTSMVSKAREELSKLAASVAPATPDR